MSAGPAWVEVVGYAASGLIVLSLVMSSVLRLRVIGLVGAIAFSGYGALIRSLPVLVANLVIVGLHVYHLRRILRDRRRAEYFEVVPWRITGAYVPRFLRFWADDIQRFQPDFTGLRDDHEALVVLRDVVPVGLVLFRQDGDRAAIDLDYVVPAHRDLRAARYVFAPDGPFPARGVRRVTATACTDAHRRYLEHLGFGPDGDIWSRTLA